MRIDLSAALDRRHAELREVAPRLLEMRDLVGAPQDLPRKDMILLYALTREFAADLVVELGRTHGNSTCVFTEAANRAGGMRVRSVCMTTNWRQGSLPRLRGLVGPDWERPLEALTADLRSLDLEGLLGPSRRTLFFWDAHGAQLAEFILGRVFPILAGRRNLVVVHDLWNPRTADFDARCFRGLGNRVWILGGIGSIFDEIIPLADFFARNRLRPSFPFDGLTDGARSVLEELVPAAEPFGPGPWFGDGTFAFFGLNGRRLAFPPAVDVTSMEAVRC